MSLRVGCALLCLSVVAGCERQTDAMVQPAMAVAPGYMRFDSGKLVQVIGFEACPDTGYALIGRIESRSMEKHCTIVSKEATSFVISIGTTVGLRKERWSVSADSRSIKLVRPDGDGATVFRKAQ